MNIDKQNNNSTLLILALTIVFVFVVLPYFDKKTNENMSNLERMMTIDQNNCSKDCCNHTQWSYPHDNRTDEMKNKYVGSNFSCENGCLCVKKQDLTNISLRGNNTPSMCS